MKILESTEQQALIKWIKLNASRFPDVERIFSIPNGGKRDKVTAIMLKREGLRANVLDLFLPKPMGGYFGLWIEMKQRLAGYLSDGQEDEISYLNRVGYLAVKCHGAKEAACTIVAYYKLGENDG